MVAFSGEGLQGGFACERLACSTIKCSEHAHMASIAVAATLLPVPSSELGQQDVFGGVNDDLKGTLKLSAKDSIRHRRASGSFKFL